MSRTFSPVVLHGTICDAWSHVCQQLVRKFFCPDCPPESAHGSHDGGGQYRGALLQAVRTWSFSAINPVQIFPCLPLSWFSSFFHATSAQWFPQWICSRCSRLWAPGHPCTTHFPCTVVMPISPLFWIVLPTSIGHGVRVASNEGLRSLHHPFFCPNLSVCQVGFPEAPSHKWCVLMDGELPFLFLALSIHLFCTWIQLRSHVAGLNVLRYGECGSGWIIGPQLWEGTLPLWCPLPRCESHIVVSRSCRCSSVSLSTVRELEERFSSSTSFGSNRVLPVPPDDPRVPVCLEVVHQIFQFPLLVRLPASVLWFTS